MSIPFSQKHGVNPSLLRCPICGESSGVALLGRLPGDAEAPRNLFDDKPCATCVDMMKQGCLLIEVDDRNPNVPARRTGRMSLVTDEGIRKAFTPEVAENVIKHRLGYIEHAAWVAVGLDKLIAEEEASGPESGNIEG